MAPRGEESVSTQFSDATASSTEPISPPLHQGSNNTSTDNHTSTNTTTANERNGLLPQHSNVGSPVSFHCLEMEDQNNCHFSSEQPPSTKPQSKSLPFPMECIERDSRIQETKPQSESSTPIKSIMTCHSSSSCSLSSTTSTTSKNDKSTKRERKSVTFQSLQIRTFHRVLGDHPCCSTGLPITFGWNPVKETKMHLEEYETLRSPRRSRHELRLNDEARRNILTLDEGDANNEKSNEISSSGEELLSQMDLKRAERRLYRNRQRVRRRVIVNRFFECPKE